MRLNCIFCDIPLKHNFTIQSHDSFSPTIFPEYTLPKDFSIGYCDACYSLQFMDLVSPEILYKDSHNDTSSTPTWKKHHDSFYEFCDQNIVDKTNILEIGGAQFILAKKFTEVYPINYAVLDFIEKDSEPKIRLINGDCEKFKFNNETIIMSHVFEHLHHQSKFLENVSLSKVNKIILSVPNLKHLLHTDNINLIHIEHTFYFTPIHLFNLFGKYSFHCTSQKEFMNHSNFFCFERKEEIYKQLTYEKDGSLSTFFERREKKFDSILFKETNTNVWIVPAGHYGYTLYQSLQKRNLHHKIKGFLDNDTSKQNKFMKSTSLCIYPFEKIKTEKDVTILIYGGPYTEEIKRQISTLNSCQFIIF